MGSSRDGGLSDLGLMFSFQMMRHLSVALLEKKDRAAKANAWKASFQLVNVLLDLFNIVITLHLVVYIIGKFHRVCLRIESVHHHHVSRKVYKEKISQFIVIA